MNLKALLDQGAGHDAEYAGGLSNHLPMALRALQALGAGDDRLHAFAQSYAVRLSPAPADEAWPAGDAWPSRFGERAAWPAYRSLFAQWIGWEGGDAVLSQALPVLMPGCGAAAFHGLIRTAYAMSSAHAGELADGLAYWACRYLDLGPLPGPGDETDPDAVLAGLQRSFAKRRFGAGLIFERMAAAAAAPGFGPQLARLRVDAATLPLLARCATALYAKSGDFTALHLVTSCHALRLLQPWLADAPEALRCYWQAYAAAAAAAFAASGIAGLADNDAPSSEATWDEIRAAAAASDNEHVIKLAYSCLEEYAACGDDGCRLAAARAAFG